MSNHLLNESGPEDEIQPITHSFIIRLWLEDFNSKRAEWRGHITHVPDGKRRYFQHIDEIISFIIPYLAEWGVRRFQHQPFGQWLRRRRILIWHRTGHENDD